MGKANKSEPNSASLRSNVCLIVGIRDAQDEKVNPDMKKKMLKNTLCLLLETFNIIDMQI
ncbi:hypothetical protein ADIARSV_0201 [Arcticibacter svalbardensis MN12-7]|uniref:Uncharacterized protein n=1 Tax=Arcticibacter svalbardensis MN12-7 TaxID=1150600 RepID=R9GYK3_9SPHI|nr:hypothetical protein ADIARSV_0201 [Arcticibacter svalbardensis MN12-7]